MTRIGTISPGHTTVLPDSNGTSKKIIENSLGIEIFSVDSKGNIRHRGKIGRTART